MISEQLVDASRLQFAVTALYHFLFVPLTLGMVWLLVIMETVYVTTGQVIWRDMTRFWGKLFGIIVTAGGAMFPFVLPSSSVPAASLTVWDSVSSRLTLGLMLCVVVVFVPLIVVYTGWAYRVMRGKVTVAHIRANDHTAY